MKINAILLITVPLFLAACTSNERIYDKMLEQHQIAVNSEVPMPIANDAYRNVVELRDELVDRGFLLRISADFPDGREAHRFIWSQVSGRFGNQHLAELAYDSNLLEVWVRAEEVEDWELFIAKLKTQLENVSG